MGGKNCFCVVAALLPMAIANNVGYRLHCEIHEHLCKQNAPDHHHTPEDSPASMGTRTDTTTGTGPLITGTATTGSTQTTNAFGNVTGIITTGTMTGPDNLWD
jgi:hypothetical protein